MFKLLKKHMKYLWEKYQDEYFDKASQNVGKYVRDYVKGEYGQTLADNSFWENEDEIIKEAQRIFADEYFEDIASIFDVDFAKKENYENDRNKIIDSIIKIINN